MHRWKRRPQIKPIQLAGMKRQPAQARGIDRVNDILDACEALLGEKRYEEISIDAIIETAGVARGTLYHFFENRRSVFLAVMHRALVEIDEQTNPKPGEDKLEFVDYVARVERRLQKVWKRHDQIVEFYEANKYSPDFNERRQQQHLRSVEVMADELRSRHPEIGLTRAQSISRTLLLAICTGLDAVSLSQPNRAAGFRYEWQQMIMAYIDSLELSKQTCISGEV
ncbi:MAG: TetR/AcrR family transcriptional regulator [Gammaproteobacteria bacterium]|nr:TetR/AcrR family transcriptional regulator [Gammaproteobacteria bacterium]